MKNSSLAIETSAATDSPPVSLHADHMEEWGLFISRCLRRSNSSSNNNQAVPEASYSCDAGYSSLPPSPNTASAKVDATDDDLAAVVPNGSDMVLPTYWFSDLSDQELEAFHDLLAKGVPDQFRRQVWMECSGALELPPFSVSSPKTLDSSNDAGEDDWVLVSNQHREEIELDMLRTAEESHPLAHDEHCIACLRNILYTYASQNPDIGYCQGMNKIAFGLLAAGLDAEDSLALLRSLLDGGILPGDLFKPPMLSLQADQLVLEELVSRSLPDLAQHLNAKLEGAAPLAPITVSWFLTLFVDYLPEPMRLRVWDMLFANGYEAVFQACLAILKLSQPTLLQCASPTAVYSVLQDIRGMMEHVDIEDFVDLAFRQMHLCASAAHIDEIRKLVCQ
ncbi:hypothetical protein GGI12_003383 [Dipsacomyces acuminosporus]|nr:hypothetical protein GGI12_003383 [Dipsacomyces acuminosporus]